MFTISNDHDYSPSLTCPNVAEDQDSETTGPIRMPHNQFKGPDPGVDKLDRTVMSPNSPQSLRLSAGFSLPSALTYDWLDPQEVCVLCLPSTEEISSMTVHIHDQRPLFVPQSTCR